MTNPRSPTSRAALLEATISELAKVGSDAVELGVVCRSIGMSPSLVNHYFGSRAALLLEAAITGYERYVERQVSVVTEAGDEPEKQLAAWISAQVEWTGRNPGIASVMNFPALHLPEGEALSLESRRRLERAAEQNLLTLASVLHRAQQGSRGRETIARDTVTKDPGLASATAYVGWLVYGHALWRAGRHAPTADIPEVRAYEALVFGGLPKVALGLAINLTTVPRERS